MVTSWLHFYHITVDYGVFKASENTSFHPSITMKALSPNTVNTILSHLVMNS
jgi:hypothetical protein